AVAKASRAVLLIGDHGAGKTITALMMIMRMGWFPVGGDTCLVRLPARGCVRVVGGTSAFAVRRSAMARWFPALPVPEGDGENADLASRLPDYGRLRAPSLVGVVMVAIDAGGTGSPALLCETQIATNALYRASGYLLAKVLDDVAANPLVLVEGAELARRRLKLVRRLPSTVGSWRGRWTPTPMAAAADELANEGSRRWAS